MPGGPRRQHQERSPLERATEAEGIDFFRDAVFAIVLDLTDRVCEDLNPSQRVHVKDAFVTTSRYEWMFWDAAWKLEGWPVG